jgi:N6-L-threonylcarbamoyladenine synthase
VVIAGGVAANGRLRTLAAERCGAAGLELRIPRIGLCTDNGAMIAAVGAHVVAAGARPSSPFLTGNPAMLVSAVLAD